MTPDDAWREMHLHLEWSEGFCLCVLFTQQPALLTAVRERLEEAWVWRTAAMTCIQPSSAQEAVAEVFTALEQHRQRLPGVLVPAWLDLCSASVADDSAAAWEQARHACLARLNEARAWLMHDLARPLVLCLPLHWARLLGQVAPDLWHVRSFTAQLVQEVARAERVLEPASVAVLTQQQAQVLARGEQTAVEAEAAARQADRPDMWRQAAQAWMMLSEQQLEWQQCGVAVASAQTAVQVFRKLLSADTRSPQVLRDLSLSLDRLGDAQRDAGQTQQALEAYRESLALRRALRASLGDEPQVLRDLSFSLDRLGDAQRDAGQEQQALEAYRESLALRRALRASRGDGPQVLRDFSL